jgi:hypothetical protein
MAKLISRKDLAKSLARAAAAKGLNKAGQLLKSKSMPLVPIDTGDLRGSGNVREASPAELEAQVGYSTPYAVAVHEDLAANHPNGGQAKYLEEPAREHEGTMLSIISDALKEVSNGSG